MRILRNVSFRFLAEEEMELQDMIDKLIEMEDATERK
jgi:hypothetical protein